ncbi:c-type cytochrome [Allomuricauda sp. NBRC 101325]|uniref:c-type cytochrome n=1 Tax=Allomuricauda sp. NBRC 101325 TaxID=1113758 RepID=UPI0024A0D04B|nr:cytochrome c [Muricauda sp. NBRC 101325]GLU45147.1 hypothetical protein Musp01_27710 [Muricauda sp. NBRC 101325]
MKSTIYYVLFVSLSLASTDFRWTPSETYVNTQEFDLKASMEKGKGVYQTLCASCHMAEGTGVNRVFPPLESSENLKDASYVAKTIKNGMSGPIKVKGVTYNSSMLAMNLSDQQISDVMNYIRNSWGNSYGPVQTKDLPELLKD